MAITKEAYQALQSIVGPEWVSDDPAICEADCHCEAVGILFGGPPVPPACSIQPGSAEEVREIVRLANRYRMPYIATSTFYSFTSSPSLDNSILMDLKRMTKLAIDDQNLYAIVEPGVSYSMLQAEAFKRGLFTFTPGSGAQCSVLANTVNAGDGPFGWRHGTEGYRRILGVEWVLPDGELVRLGSRATSKDFFWGEGPGPDLRGLLRPHLSGGMGVVTRMAVKLFPFIPERLEPAGLGPQATLKLPEKRLKWWNVSYPSPEKAVELLRELGRCEIGLIAMTVPSLFTGIAAARRKGSTEAKKAEAAAPAQETRARILLFGCTSEKHMEYEERVLLDIVAETGGSARPGRPSDFSWFMAADSISVAASEGVFASMVAVESIDHALKVAKMTDEIKRKYTPPLPPTVGSLAWYVAYELGHICKMESIIPGTIEDMHHLGALIKECIAEFIKVGACPAFLDPGICGPACYNFHEKLRMFKKAFDPNGVSNPPQPLGTAGL